MQKPPRWLAFVTWFPLMATGFYVGRKFPPVWDVNFFIAASESSAVILLAWLCLWDIVYKLYLYQVDVSSPSVVTQPISRIPVKVDGVELGELVYNQITTAPRFDMERHLAVVSVRSLDDGQEPDFRETTWVNKDKHNRFPTRSAYIKVIEKWKRIGVIDRKDPTRDNSSYKVISVPKIKLIAYGEKFE